MAKDANQQFDNTNKGALFKNDRKNGDADPDYRGTINVDGRELWVSAWVKTSAKGVRFMSLALKPKDDTSTTSKPAARSAAPF